MVYSADPPTEEVPHQGDRREQKRWSRSVSLGDVLTILAMLGSMFYFYGNLSAQLGAIDTKVDALWSDFLNRTVRK